jgi:hypothetical protein
MRRVPSLTQDDLHQLRALREKTARRWEIRTESDGPGTVYRILGLPGGKFALMAASAVASQRKRDIEFANEAHLMVPGLIEEIERLWGILGEVANSDSVTVGDGLWLKLNEETEEKLEEWIK